jgi:hypothetical protein
VRTEVPETVSETSADLLSRQQLAQRLGRSLRWVDARVREGMPSEPPTEGFPHRRFQIDQVDAWLEERGATRAAVAVDDAELPDLQDLADALARASAAVRAENLSAIAGALRALAAAAGRLADGFERFD